MIPRRRVPLLSSNPPAAEYYGETVKPIDVLRFWHKSIFQRLIYRCNAPVSYTHLRAHET